MKEKYEFKGKFKKNPEMNETYIEVPLCNLNFF